MSKEIIKTIVLYNPYINGYCDKCKNKYILDGDEKRCRKIHIGLSDVMCAQVKECNAYRN